MERMLGIHVSLENAHLKVLVLVEKLAESAAVTLHLQCVQRHPFPL